MAEFYKNLKKTGLFLILAGAVSVFPVPVKAINPPETQATIDSYFPLAVGNSWNYRCSDGESVSYDSVKILSSVIEKENIYFRTERKTHGSPNSEIYYLGMTPDGTVFETDKINSGVQQLLVNRSPKKGDHLGEWTVGDFDWTTTRATKRVKAVLVENPRLSPSERDNAAWEGRYYAKNIGLVAKAFNGGGECELEKFHLEKSQQGK